MSIYVVSDLHSCYSKFLKSIPHDTKKLIILGDLFNKGREQKEMFRWVFKNRKNPKYVFVRGNCELRCNNEIIRHYAPNQTHLYFDWFGSHDGYKNKNIANVVIEMIEDGEFEFHDVLDMLQNDFKWYHIEENWIMAHASWEFNKTPQQQNKLNLCYDTYRMLPLLRSKDYKPKILPLYEGMRFIFGHTPVKSIVTNAIPPVVIGGRFFFIDNGIFKTANPMFYLKIK